MNPTTPDALAAYLARSTPSAGLWDELDFGRLSAAGRVDAAVACERLVRHAEAQLARALGALDQADLRTDELERGCTEAEVSAALRWASSTVQARLYEAGILTSRFPEALASLSRGEIGWVQARALVESTATLDDAAARCVQDRVLPLMPGQFPATTRKALCRAVFAVDPEGAQRRHSHEKARRRVELRPEQDGMATLALYTTAEAGTALLAAVTHIAKTRAPGDSRTLDQRRADTLADLVLSGSGVRFSETQHPHAAFVPSGAEVRPSETQRPDAALVSSGSNVRPTETKNPDNSSEPRTPAALVHVVIGIDTLLGAAEEPGELRGYGPIAASQARALAFAPGSVWQRLLTAPDGTLIHADPRTYKPTAPVARHVRLRDQTCTFPGCGMPATRCDLDHVEPFDHRDPAAGGRTTPDNLHALCRRHHLLKTAGRWAVTRDPATDTTTWTAPTKHVYATHPRAYAVAA